MLISQKQRSRFKKGQIFSNSSEGGTCSFEHDTAQNGKVNRSRGPVERETMQQNDTTPEGQGKVHLEKMIVLRVSTTKEEIVVMIESVIICISRSAKTSRKINVKWERIDRSSTHTWRIDLPVQKEKVKEKSHKRKSNGWHGEYRARLN